MVIQFKKEGRWHTYKSKYKPLRTKIKTWRLRSKTKPRKILKLGTYPEILKMERAIQLRRKYKSYKTRKRGGQRYWIK